MDEAIEENAEPTFSYKELVTVLEIDKKPFHHNSNGSHVAFISKTSVHGGEKDFYELHCTTPEEDYDDQADEGFKFHISLGYENDYEGNVEKGWDIIKDIAKKYNIGSLKVIRSGKQMTGTQQGKDVTIYPFVDLNKTPEDWLMIMSEITVELYKAGVQPGPQTVSHSYKKETHFEGNPFVSGRHQFKDEHKRSEEDLMEAIPPENPYEEMDFSIKACIERLDKADNSNTNVEMNSEEEFRLKKGI